MRVSWEYLGASLLIFVTSLIKLHKYIKMTQMLLNKINMKKILIAFIKVFTKLKL